MSSKESLPTHTVLDGKLHVFRRVGSPFWWTGFHFKGKYIRHSTKQTSSEAADAVAIQWYFKKQTEIASGEISSPKHAFNKVAEEALTAYNLETLKHDPTARNDVADRITAACKVANITSKLDAIL